MPSDLVEMLLNKAGIETPVYHPGVKGASPLPVLHDKHGGRVHVIARTVWIGNKDVPTSLLLMSAVENVGGRRILSQLGTMRSNDGDVVRCANAYQLLGDITKLTLVLAKRTPWTPESAAGALHTRLHDLSAIDGVLNVGVVPRIYADSDRDFDGAADSATVVSDTYTVAFHCTSTSAIDRRTKPLLEAAGTYGELINYVAVIDKHNQFRPGHPASKKNYYVWVPYFNEDGLAVAVEGLLPNIARNDLDGFRQWVEFMAERRCSAEWPYRQEVHELVKHFHSFLIGMSTEDELQAALNEISLQGALLEETRATAAQLDVVAQSAFQDVERLKERVAEADERARQADELKDQAEQNALLQMVRAQQLFDLNEGLKEELAESVQHTAKLKRRADAAVAIETALKEENDGLRRALRASEERARAVVAVRLAEDPWQPLRAPAAWDELYECAAQLKNVRMTASAVEPALKDLAHHTYSASWLEKAWGWLATLDAFALTDRDDYLNFRVFCETNPTDGLTATSIVVNEGQTVRTSPRMSAERLFSTEDGPMEMLSHIRMGAVAPWPRLYFRVDEGVVYVGRIGPHLTNTKTN